MQNQPEIIHCVLVGGPRRRQAAAFFGKWLQAASHMDDLWQEACCDPKFARGVERLRVVFEPNFDLVAIELVTQLKPDLFYKYEPLIVSLADWEGDEVTIMILAGLFAKVGLRYDFAIPEILTVDVVRAACLRLASTEDEQHSLHPEYVVESLSPEMAGRWKATQMCMDLNQGIR